MPLHAPSRPLPRLLPHLLPHLLALAFAATAATAQAGIVDAAGDYVPGFAGSTLGDLDVLAANVTYESAAHRFNLSATMAADIGQTANGFYVWGVNRGQGTARFAANGISGVLFDMVVIVNQDGSGRVNDLVGGLPAFVFGAGTAQISGATMSLDLDDSHLPTRGTAASFFTWNLWPRDGRTSLVGFAQISDFAPDNTNFTTQVIPEPSTALLAALGVLGLCLLRKKAR